MLNVVLMSALGAGTLSPAAAPKPAPHSYQIIPLGTPVTALSFSATGQHLAVAGADLSVRVYDLSRPGDAPVQLPVNGTRAVFNPNPNRPAELAVANQDGRVVVYDVAQRNTKAVFAHSGPGISPVLSVAYNADGTRLASGAGDGTIKVWALANPAGDPALGRQPNDAPVRALAFGPKGDYLVSGGGNGVVAGWRVPASGAFNVAWGSNVPALTSGVTAVALSGAAGKAADGVAAVAFDSGRIEFYDFASQGNAVPLAGVAGVTQKHLLMPANGIAFDPADPSARTVVTAGGDGRAFLFRRAVGGDPAEAETPGWVWPGLPVAQPGHRIGVSAVAFDPINPRLAVATHDGSVHVLDKATGTGATSMHLNPNDLSRGSN